MRQLSSFDISSLSRKLTWRLYLQYLGTCIHQWNFSSFPVKDFFNGLQSKNFAWCSTSSDSFTPCRFYYCTLRAINTNKGFSCICQQLTSLESSHMVSTISDSNAFLHMVRLARYTIE